MKRMRILALISSVLWGFSILSSAPTWAAQSPLLAEKHKGLAIDCTGCHKENPPKEKAPSSACMGCHGDYKRMGGKTEKRNPNPHDSHIEELDCGECHHIHKASENYCGTCHKFEFKVP